VEEIKRRSSHCEAPVAHHIACQQGGVENSKYESSADYAE